MANTIQRKLMSMEKPDRIGIFIGEEETIVWAERGKTHSQPAIESPSEPEKPEKKESDFCTRVKDAAVGANVLLGVAEHIKHLLPN